MHSRRIKYEAYVSYYCQGKVVYRSRGADTLRSFDSRVSSQSYENDETAQCQNDSDRE